MQKSATLADKLTSVRNLIQAYFDSWQGTDEDKIMAWYSDDVRLWLPSGLLEDKIAVRDRFVRPFLSGFPGNVHEIQRLVHGDSVIAVEWRFKAEHRGEFQGIPATGRHTDVPGCSFYTLNHGVIAAGNIYFNIPTLLHQIGVPA